MASRSLGQFDMLHAGAQPWNRDVCAAAGHRFLYSATLAIYIFEYDDVLEKFKLHSIMSEHKKTITCIAWSPHNINIFASGSAENIIIVWNIQEQSAVACIDALKHKPVCLEWCPLEKETIAFIGESTPLYLWNFESSKVTVHKEASGFALKTSVFRWHPKNASKIVFGHCDGSISLVDTVGKGARHALPSDERELSCDDDWVRCVEWDPLSSDYLLVMYEKDTLKLIDTLSMTVITRYVLPSAAAKLACLSWIPGAPGMFVTGDSNSGIVRLWTVSKNEPIMSLTIKEAGFHSFRVVTTANRSPYSSINTPYTRISSTSPSVVKQELSSSMNGYTFPPVQIACTFSDGGVGLYDVGKRNWEFIREQGHIETIFSCSFNPDNYNLLATSSFDGSIKVWDIATMRAVHVSPGNSSIIYCISWGPGSMNCIAAATSKNGCFVWDIERNQVVRRFNQHGKYSVYVCAWNQKDPRYLATAGADGNCIIHLLEEETPAILQKYSHPGPIYGCDWSSKTRDMIATGCEDGLVRIFYLPTNADQPLKVFAGHTAKVFQVRWSPLRDGILCSGCDAGTIRIWDYMQGGCVHCLEGHSAPVRGLLWSPELPFVLLSGSWDNSIRIWDTRTGYCIDSSYDHAADVYGLACHPQRPFVIASCSRDSTLRLWSMDSAIRPLYCGLLAGKSMKDIIHIRLGADCHEAEKMEHQLSPRLYGQMSANIQAMLESDELNDPRHQLQAYTHFFLPPAGVSNMWTLVSVILDGKKALLPENYSEGIVHSTHLIHYKASEAQELETIKSGLQPVIGSRRKEDRLREAAHIHMKLGQLNRYCEIMIELNEWDRALAVAPGVSMDYWRDLTERRARVLSGESNPEAEVYYVAAGDVKQLAEYYASRKQYRDAMLVLQVAVEANETSGEPCPNGEKRCGHMNGTPEAGSKSANGRAIPDSSRCSDLLRYYEEASGNYAEWYFRDGQPVLAACCYLAVNKCKKAASILIRGNELELAVTLARLLPACSETLTVATELLARRCEKLGLWTEGIALLKSLPNPEMALCKLCATYVGSAEDTNSLFLQAGFPPQGKHAELARGCIAQDDVFGALKHWILSTESDQALIVGLKHIKSLMSAGTWTLDEILPIIQLLAFVKPEKMLHTRSSRRLELLGLSAYVGALRAIRLHYNTIVPHLFSLASKLFSEEKLDLALESITVHAECEAWLAHFLYNREKKPAITVKPTKDQEAVYEKILLKCGVELDDDLVGEYILHGQYLPSHSAARADFFSGRKIKGPVYFLEDGLSALRMSDALMWARVNAFSPLGTGVRINPF